MDWTKPIYNRENTGDDIPEICGSCGESEGFYFKNETDECLTCVNCGQKE